MQPLEGNPNSNLQADLKHYCQYCYSVFSSQKTLKNHLSLIHKVEVHLQKIKNHKISCPSCLFEIRIEDVLRKKLFKMLPEASYTKQNQNFIAAISSVEVLSRQQHLEKQNSSESQPLIQTGTTNHQSESTAFELQRTYIQTPQKFNIAQQKTHLPFFSSDERGLIKAARDLMESFNHQIMTSQTFPEIIISSSPLNLGIDNNHSQTLDDAQAVLFCDQIKGTDIKSSDKILRKIPKHQEDVRSSERNETIQIISQTNKIHKSHQIRKFQSRIWQKVHLFTAEQAKACHTCQNEINENFALCNRPLNFPSRSKWNKKYHIYNSIKQLRYKKNIKLQLQRRREVIAATQYSIDHEQYGYKNISRRQVPHYRNYKLYNKLNQYRGEKHKALILKKIKDNQQSVNIQKEKFYPREQPQQNDQGQACFILQSYQEKLHNLRNDIFERYLRQRNIPKIALNENTWVKVLPIPTQLQDAIINLKAKIDRASRLNSQFFCFKEMKLLSKQRQRRAEMIANRFSLLDLKQQSQESSCIKFYEDEPSQSHTSPTKKTRLY